MSPDGRAIAIHSKKDFCIMYDDEDEGEGDIAAAASGVSLHPAFGERNEPEKEWESEGLSLVMEDDEEEADEDGPSGHRESSVGEHRAEAAMGRGSVLQGKAWRPSDAHLV